MKITITGTPEEIAAHVLAIQKKRKKVNIKTAVPEQNEEIDIDKVFEKFSEGLKEMANARTTLSYRSRSYSLATPRAFCS